MQQQSKAESPWNAVVTTLTRSYRHEALNMCQEDSSVIGWEIAQHLLDQCWSDAIPTGKTSSIIHVCPECGATLHPGFNSTSLRVARFSKLKGERTRRRRILRKQKRLRIAQLKQSKVMNRSNAPDKSEEKPAIEHVLLRDDPDLLFARHHLILKCQRCHCRIRLKGLKREVPPTKQEIRPKKISANQSFKAIKKTLIEDQASGGVDFLRLPTSSNAGTTRVPATVSRPSVQNTKKDKKKKGDRQDKKSKLMSFLSSLND
jgi:hypothetical protein